MAAAVSVQQPISALPTKFTAPLTPVQTRDQLYHVLLSIYHDKHDPNSKLQQVQVCGTYTSLSAAKAAGYRCLFDAGYEGEWFSEYEVNVEKLRAAKHKNGLLVSAVAQDNTRFDISIATTPNAAGVESNDEGKVEQDLYHVLQTIIFYVEDESGDERETIVEGTFTTYEKARENALTVLLSSDDGVTKDSFAEYTEAAPSEPDCGYGENCLVHAVGSTGETYLVTVIKGQEMEAARLARSASQML